MTSDDMKKSIAFQEAIEGMELLNAFNASGDRLLKSYASMSYNIEAIDIDKRMTLNDDHLVFITAFVKAVLESKEHDLSNMIIYFQNKYLDAIGGSYNLERFCDEVRDLSYALASGYDLKSFEVSYSFYYLLILISKEKIWLKQ